MQDPENLVKGAIKEIVQKLGKKVITGKFFDALKMTGPARLATPMTFLEMFQ